MEVKYGDYNYSIIIIFTSLEIGSYPTPLELAIYCEGNV